MSGHSVGERPSRIAHLVERAAALMRTEAALRPPGTSLEDDPLAIHTPEPEPEPEAERGPESEFEPEAESQSRAGSENEAKGASGVVPGGEAVPDDKADDRTEETAVQFAPEPAVQPAAETATAEPAKGPTATANPAAPPAMEAVPQPGPPMLDLAALQRAGLVLTGNRSRVAEEFRIAVTRTMRALRGSRAGRPGSANLLMVTSSRPNEGKSFSSLNIAASIAQNGLADVLLIDLDSKPRSLSALLGLGGRDGLLDLAVGWGSPSATSGTLRNPEPLIARTAIEGFTVLPIGSRKPGAEGAVTRAVTTTLERISRRFPRHVIVLDTAPCLSTSDPSTLASLVDEVLLIVEAERTQRSELEASLDLLKAASNITMMLNKTRFTQRHTFGSYYYFDEPSS